MLAAVVVLAGCGSAGTVGDAPASADPVPETTVTPSSPSVPTTQLATNTASTGSADSTPGTSPATTVPATDDSVDALTRFTWYLYGVSNAPDGVVPWHPVLSVRFTRSDGSALTVSIDAGCRAGSGQVALGPADLMTVSEMKLTEKSCTADEVAVADVVVSTFDRPMRWAVQSHQLTLMTASGTGPTLQWRETPDGTPATDPSPDQSLSAEAPPSTATVEAMTHVELGGFVFSYPTSLGLVPVPDHLFTSGDPNFPSISQDFGDGHGHLLTMTIAVGGEQLIDSNAEAGDPLATVLIGDRTFYTPNHHDDPNSYGLMYVIGDHVAAFGFSLFTPDEALTIVKRITVVPDGN